jgi:hypothetical protein
MRIHTGLIPEEIQHEYNTKAFVDKDGYVYMEVTGAIYGLSQSGYGRFPLELSFSERAAEVCVSPKIFEIL